jgi:hypothetical protein
MHIFSFSRLENEQKKSGEREGNANTIATHGSEIMTDAGWRDLDESLRVK